MEQTSWGGSYRAGADGSWADATLWIEDGDLGIGLSGTWTIVPAVALADVVSVSAVGEHAGGTELEITLVAGHAFSLIAPTGFVDEFIGALQSTSVLDLTEQPPTALPAAPASDRAADLVLPPPPPPPHPASEVASVPTGPATYQPFSAAEAVSADDAIRCEECGVLCLTLADLRDHELVHQPRVEFVPFPSA